MDVALLIGACAILTAFFVACVKPDAGDGLIGALIFVPAIFYLVHDRGLSEIGAFGATVKLRQATSERLTASDAMLTPLSGIVDIMPGSMDIDGSDGAFGAALFEPCVEFVRLRSDRIPARGAAAFDRYILTSVQVLRSSLVCGKLIGMVVVDERDRYIGSLDAEFFREALAFWVLGREPAMTRAQFRDLVMRYTVFGAALGHPEARITAGEGFRAAIGAQATLLSAYQSLQSTDARFLVVTSTLGAVEGVVTRDQIERRMLSAVVDAFSRD